MDDGLHLSKNSGLCGANAFPWRGGCGGIRFYGKEILCRPIQIPNLGPDTLKICCGRFCTMLEPEQQPSSAPTAMVCED